MPVKFMAAMGLFLVISVILQLKFMPSGIQTFGLLMKGMMDVMLNNLSIIFCIGIASSMAYRKKLEAALLALVSFLFFLAANNAWLSLTGMLAKPGPVGFYGTGQGMVLGFQVLDMNVFLGMMIGSLVAFMHNRFSDREFTDIFSIYGGPRFTFILLVPSILVLAIVMSYVWPVINSGITSLSNLILTTGLFGLFIYAFLNRFLVPTGLHHLIWMPFCFTALGGTAEINGKIYMGAANILFAEIANAGSITALDPSLRFATFGFAKIFGSIAVGLAIIHTAHKHRRKEVRGQMLPPMLVGSAAGITEPLDFSFFFASPLLWLVHSLLAATSEVILWAIGARTYMLFGFIDSIVSSSVFPPGLTKFYLVLIVGAIMGVIWYLVFVFLIRRLNIKTPGREDEESAAPAIEEGKHATAATKQIKESDVAQTIAGLGGAENIKSVSNCFTRLRVTVFSEAKVDKSMLEKISTQKGIVQKGENIQIIFGMGVPAFKEAISATLGLKD